MKATMTALVAVMTITSLGLAAGTASACGGHGGGYGGYGGGYNYNKVYVKKVYVQPVVVEPCFYPAHCFAIVTPGDTWFTISLREYGRPHLWKKIAIFNGLPLSAGVAPGMQLKLPEIHPDGSLLPSNAPAPIAFGAPVGPVGLPQGGPVSQANFIPQGIPQGGPQANMIPPTGNFGPQMNGLPQGANFAAPQGAAFNGAPMNGAPMNGAPMNGAQLNAPAFNGASAPVGPIGAPNGAPGMFNGNGPIMPNLNGPGAPIANIKTVSSEVKLPSVAIGSILSLDGQSLGNERGLVRLSINGLTLPVEVLEWSTVGAKIQLPQIELAGPVKAELEVLRADGSLASKSTIELTPATNRLALGN